MPEVDQVMFLSSLCQANGIKGVRGINRRSQSLIVFFYHQQVVECFVNRFVVVVLDRA